MQMCEIKFRTDQLEAKYEPLEGEGGGRHREIKHSKVNTAFIKDELALGKVMRVVKVCPQQLFSELGKSE